MWKNMKIHFHCTIKMKKIKHDIINGDKVAQSSFLDEYNFDFSCFSSFGYYF